MPVVDNESDWRRISASFVLYLHAHTEGGSHKGFSRSVSTHLMSIGISVSANPRAGGISSQADRELSKVPSSEDRAEVLTRIGVTFFKNDTRKITIKG